MLLAAGLVPRSRFCRRRCEFGSLEEGVPGSEEGIGYNGGSVARFG